ncbi:MAG TPA: helix-turn-helix domain-containing protein [Edaphobacter sp.]|nr:helix-turn-helix domain-containing protein [Edaphobacter sp.]
MAEGELRQAVFDKAYRRGNEHESFWTTPHFKTPTNMTPLQYQKRLRLQEARRLMLADAMDASAAAYPVGYVSRSQFSREYSRLFGAHPLHDVE